MSERDRTALTFAVFLPERHTTVTAELSRERVITIVAGDLSGQRLPIQIGNLERDTDVYGDAAWHINPDINQFPEAIYPPRWHYKSRGGAARWLINKWLKRFELST